MTNWMAASSTITPVAVSTGERRVVNRNGTERLAWSGKCLWWMMMACTTELIRSLAA